MWMLWDVVGFPEAKTAAPPSLWPPILRWAEGWYQDVYIRYYHGYMIIPSIPDLMIQGQKNCEPHPIRRIGSDRILMDPYRFRLHSSWQARLQNGFKEEVATHIVRKHPALSGAAESDAPGFFTRHFGRPE